jgi:hypothetical protein
MRVTSLLAASLAATFLAPVSAPAAPAAATSLSLPIGGQVDGGGAFSGTFTLQRFALQNGHVVAVGQISGILRDSLGIATTVFKTASLPVSLSSGGVTTTATTAVLPVISCGILHLELGPLDLDLLGLVVHLDRVVLDISAEPGAGNLLGNLLCAIVGLLDSPGTQLVQLLNNLLALL